MSYVLQFPCIGNGLWELSSELFTELRQRYPGVDTLLSLRKCVTWLEQNASRKRQPGEMPALLDEWLRRESEYQKQLPKSTAGIKPAPCYRGTVQTRTPHRVNFREHEYWKKSKADAFALMALELGELDKHLEQIEFQWAVRADVTESMWEKVGRERSLVIHLRKWFSGLAEKAKRSPND